MDLVLDCHERIRRFAGLAQTLAQADAPVSEIAEAAQVVHRYFTLALPLHTLDEDHSLLPRLFAHDLPEETEHTLVVIQQEHREIGRLLAHLTPVWRDIAAGPQARARRVATAEPMAQLRALMEQHLLAEEKVLFPALRRCLQADELAAISAEMRARREKA